MRRLVCRIVSAVLLTAVPSVGCTERDCDRKLFTTLEDPFVYVGSVPDPGQLEIMTPHGTDPIELPETIAPETFYIFHNVRSINHEEFATDVLPRRLRDIGAELLYVPSEGSMLEFFAGGVAFHISFRYCGRRFSIGTLGPENRIETDTGYWFVNDYFIIVSESRE